MVVKQDVRFDRIMAWIRIMIPIIIAGLGWYIGQTVGVLNARLAKLETGAVIHREDFIEHKANHKVTEENLKENLNKLINTDSITRREIDNIEKRLERIEHSKDK